MSLLDTIKNTKDSRYEVYLDIDVIKSLSQDGKCPIYPMLMYDKDSDCLFIDIYNDGFTTTYMTPTQVHKVIQLLENYCNAFTDDEVCRYNYEKDEKFRIEYEESLKPCSKQDKLEKERIKNAGYIYILECGNRFKIGFSKNVENRIKQLDVRPFKLRLLHKIYDEQAYDIEQALHKRLINYKVDSEWYDFKVGSLLEKHKNLSDDEVIADIISDIVEMIFEIKNDMQ